jgi:hypothetical protein
MTTENFAKLFNLKRHDNTYKLKSIYSYDIKDNPEFRKS